MKQDFSIDGRLPGLNEYTAAERTNKYKGAALKRKYTMLAKLSCLKIAKFTKPVEIHFLWVEPNARRDPDNFTSFGRKVILDGLVAAGKIPQDSQKYIKGWSDSWVVNPDNPGVLVIITEES